MTGASEPIAWCTLATTLLPLSLGLRLWFWANPLLAPDAGTQTSSALRAYELHASKSLWSAAGPGLPLYEWVCARFMDAGFSVEYATRFVALLSFFGAGWVLVSFIGRRLGRRTACWTALLWLVSPVNILYSRACAPEFTAVWLLLVAGTRFLSALSGTGRLPWKDFGMVVTAGGLAALMAFPLWMAPAALGLVAVGWGILKRGFSERLAALGLALILQAGLAAAWISRYGMDALGPWSPALGKQLVRLASLGVFQGWMLVPFLLALLLGKKENRSATTLLCLLAAAPMALYLGAFAEHEAKLAGVTLYLVVLTALGMERLFSLPPTLRGAWLGIGLSLLVWRMERLEETFGSIARDHRESLASARQLKALTSVEDLIFYGGPSKDAHLALYSQRTVQTSVPGDRALAASAVPKGVSVFLFDAKGPDLDRLAAFDPIWIDSATDLSLYRVAAKGKFSFDKGRLLGVGSYSSRMPDYFFDDTGTLRVRAMPHPSSFLVIEMVRPGSSLSVKAVDADVTFVFPKKDFVFLPAPAVERPETYEITLVP